MSDFATGQHASFAAAKGRQGPLATAIWREQASCGLPKEPIYATTYIRYQDTYPFPF